MKVDFLLKLAFATLFSLTPLEAMAEGSGVAAGQTACEKKYEAGRQQLLKVMGTNGFDIRDEKGVNNLIEKRLCAQSRVISSMQASYKTCRDSYLKIRASVINSEDRAKEACQILNEANKVEAGCAQGQAECFRATSAKYRAAAAKVKEARESLAAGVEQAKKAADANKLVALDYANDLSMTADAKRMVQNRAASDPAYAAQVKRRQAAGESLSDIAIANLNPKISREVSQVVQYSNAGGSSPEELMIVSQKIQAANSYGVDVDPSTIKTGAGAADEAVQANLTSGRFAHYAPQFEKDLNTSETNLNNWALEADRRAKGLAPVPQTSAGGSSPSPTQETKVAAAPNGVALGSAPAAASPTGLNSLASAFVPGLAQSSTGASRAVAYSKGGSIATPLPSSARLGNRAASSGTAIAIPAFAETAAATPKAGEATPGIARATGSDGRAPNAPLPQAAAAATLAEMPAFSGGLAAAPSMAGSAIASVALAPKASASPEVLEAGARALENPQVKSIVDSEMARLGSRAPASESLRERLRRRLAANVASKLEAAEKAKPVGAATGSMASLLNEARARSDGDREAYEKSFELGSAETDAEVARLMGKHDSEQLSEIPGALSTQSLFERVHSAHTRFQKSGAKKEEVLSRNP